MKRWYILISAVVVILLGVGAIYFAAGSKGKMAGEMGVHKHEQKVQRYHCPMHPDFVSDKPGACPICGMNLVPMEEPEEAKPSPSNGGHTSIDIPPESQKLIGVKTDTVKTGKAEKIIRTVGKVAFDPELAIAEREFIEASNLGDKSLRDAAHQRLLVSGLGEEQIKELASKKKVERNLYLPDKTAYVYPVVYESDLPFAKVGQMARVEFPNGDIKEGKILAVDPVIDEKTRTARLRVEISNEEKAVRPNMFVNVVIVDDLGEKLLVPKGAVIDTGERRIVFVIHDGMHFEPRIVKLGAELADSFVVDSGLAAGDVVVTSANFVIDSESRLRSAVEGMAGHKHGE